MSNGGIIAQRGFILQSIIAVIECLEREDWDKIKMEPDTDNDKVDFMLYQKGSIKSAIQVKSSSIPFERSFVKISLDNLLSDAGGAKEAYLYLVGDAFKPLCEDFIRKNNKHVKTIPFNHLPDVCTGTIARYVQKVGLGGAVTVEELYLIGDSLFATIHKNSLVKAPIDRHDFEAAFHKVLSIRKGCNNQSAIPKRLTPIPFLDPEVGLIGRKEVVKKARKMIDENTCMVVVSGLGGIGKTSIMQEVCNELMIEGNYVAWVRCSESLRDDLLMLRGRLGVPEIDSNELSYEQVIEKIGQPPLEGRLYLFLDDLSRKFTKEERSTLNGLGIHVMITSRKENLHLPKLQLNELEEEYAIDLFYAYYGGDVQHQFIDVVRGIVNNVRRHTLLIELLAKAAWKSGGTLEKFEQKLKDRSFFDVFEGRIATEHDDENLTIEESVIRLYHLSELSQEQQRIMQLFTILSPEKPVFDKVCEWADFNINDMYSLVELGWLEKVERGYVIHQIVRDALGRQVGEVCLDRYLSFRSKVVDTDGYIGKSVPFEIVRERIVLAEDVARFLEKTEKMGNDTGAILNNLAGVYCLQGDYEKALEYYGKALIIREHNSKISVSDSDIQTTYCNIASVYRNQGNNEMALYYYRKAIDMIEERLNMYDSRTVMLLCNLSDTYRDLEMFEEASNCNRIAYSLVEGVLESADIECVSSDDYFDSGWICERERQYNRALYYYELALAIQEQVLGKEHLDTGKTYAHIAQVYIGLNEYETALEYYKTALSIYRHIMGADHKYEKVLKYYNRAISFHKRIMDAQRADAEYTHLYSLYNKRSMYFILLYKELSQ